MRGKRDREAQTENGRASKALPLLTFFPFLLPGKTGNAGFPFSPFSPFSPRCYFCFFCHHNGPCRASR